MEFKFREVSVSEVDPFENDKLDRIPHVKNLTRLLINISSPISLSVNAPWGSGKTTFLKMLKAELASRGATTIYFSAWESDFAPDPLLVFLGELNTTLCDWTMGNSTKRAAWEKAKSAGLYLAKRSIPVGIKLSTLGLIDTDKVIEDELARLSSTFSEDAIKEYVHSKDQVSVFKNNIRELLLGEEHGSNKLFIVIDELDRCRPLYAIEFLERIKHLLDVEGLVFVLALDKEQLSHSIRGVYGSDFDSKGYLRRFFDIEYQLPNASVHNYIEHGFEVFNLNEFFDSRTQKLGEKVRYDAGHLKMISITLFEVMSLSLREFEQAFSKLNLYLLSIPKNTPLNIPLVTFLIFLKEYDYESYSEFISSNSPDKMINYFIKLLGHHTRYESFPCALIEGCLIGAKCYGSLKESEYFTQHDRDLGDESIENERRSYAGNVVSVASQNSLSAHDFDRVIQRIEMLESFNLD